uniref:Pericentrin/AKAP-450 centrosomal targeting domain-containing protein n=1 Tax=Ornithorhynchus anatinus TaxID=9258 RepID=A0A6I8NKQ2_ORNAN
MQLGDSRVKPGALRVLLEYGARSPAACQSSEREAGCHSDEPRADVCCLNSREVLDSELGEEEGEFGVGEVFSERGAQDGQARLEAAETELAGRLQEIEELSRELEEARAAYGPEGLQQLQEFEAAITQRDGIISQLTAHLQQARREKDESMREFLELTEQSQKLQLQFQHLQASETLRNSTHSSTAADLLQARQQAATQQQQLEEQGRRLVDYQKQQQEFQKEIAILEEKIQSSQTERHKEAEESRSRELEREAALEVLKARLAEGEERHSTELKDHGLAREKQLEDLREQMARRDREVASARLELAQARQRERQSSEEVRRLMGSVEELQKRQHAGGWAEQEAQRRLEQLRAELEETHGQQIVQMKKELTLQHLAQTEALRARHQAELERAAARDPVPPIDELRARLHEALAQRDGLSRDLVREREVASAEKSTLERRLGELQAELDLARERGRQAGADLERRLAEALGAAEDLKAQAATAAEVTRELQAKHEAEVTNYRIKLEMLEREKDAVLDRMAEAQEADLDSLRTQLLFRHEEELSRLREDLEGEHRANVARLKESLGLRHEQQLEGLRAETRRQVEALQMEKDGLVTRQNQLLLELSALRDVQQSPGTSEAEETARRLRELQKEVEGLRRGENEKGTLELEVQELQLKAELLEKELREKEALLREGLGPPGDGDGREEPPGLTEENRRLTQQCARLKEEVDRQRDTFSFAEKNFEVNYQELREEYACLLKLKADLEEGRSRQEAEHREKVRALTQELRRLRASGPGAPRDAGAPGAETAEPGEVVEKDTTELMEKLEVTQREKLELSERLSALSGQLDQKHREVDRLHGRVDSLQREKDQLLAMCRELEAVAQRQGADLHGAPVAPEPSGAEAASQEFPRPPGQGVRENGPPPSTCPAQSQGAVPIQTCSKGEATDCPTLGKPAHLCVPRFQADLRLQMEAQRLCLSLVHSTHLAHVREAMESEREQALSGLKEELASAHAQELEELQEAHRLELRTSPGRGAGMSSGPLPRGGAAGCSTAYWKYFPNFWLVGKAERHFCFRSSGVPWRLPAGPSVWPSWASPRGCLLGLRASALFREVPSPEVGGGPIDWRGLTGSSFFQGRVVPEDEPDADVVRQLERRYQERLEEEVAKVIVSMSVAFAQQSERARLSGLREAHAPGRRTHAPFRPEQSLASEMELADGEPAPPPWGAHVSTFQEELKALSQGLSEDESRKILVLGSERGDGELELEARELACAGRVFPRDQDFVLKDTMRHDVPEASLQLRLHEEKLEDLRQELVRQCEEHQQVTERLRQAHMRQMERQREDQEQLQEEIHRLNRQLAQSSSVDTENLVSERERVLLEELESLKQRALAGREQLCFQVHSRSTQTQEPDLSEEAQEPIPGGEERERNAEDVAPDGLSAERHALRQANRRLLKGLLEVAKTTVAAEETIGRHVLGLLNRSGGAVSLRNEWCVLSGEPAAPFLEREGPGRAPGPWTEAPGGGEDLCQLVLRSGSAGPDVGPESEELALNVSSRLQAAVGKLLDAINTTSDQLEHARVAQTELLRESSRQTQEAAELLRCQEELQERLREEGKAREQLAEELSKAEGVIDSYADDKALLEREVQEKTDAIGRLEQELLRAGNRLQELEAERQQVQEEKALLSRQKEALSAEAGPAEQQFLQETEKLAKEKLDVQRQAEKERDDLQKQVRTLEVDVEEQVSRFLELEQEKNAELADLRQQNQALEKQLEKTRKFLDEQAVDREHERDVFQQEIQKLEEQLKAVPRFQPVSEEQAREVEQLTEQLKEKTDRCSEGLLAAEQLQRDLQERDDQLDRLGCRLRELEQALVLGPHGRPEVGEQQRAGAADGKGELALEAQLQVEREAVDRKEKEIANLEEQLEQFREELENKNEEVQQLHMQLEIQKKESTTRLAELQLDNQLFKEELGRLGLAVQGSEGTVAPDPHLIVGKFARILQEKELEIQELNEQMAKLQQQLETAADNKVIEEKNELLRELEAQVERLKSDREWVKKRSQEEVEQLNDVIEKLQQELAGLDQKEPVGGALPPGGADSLKRQLEAALAGDTEAVATGAADTVALEPRGQAPAKEVVVSGPGRSQCVGRLGESGGPPPPIGGPGLSGPANWGGSLSFSTLASQGRESQAATLQEELEQARGRLAGAEEKLAGALRREEEPAALDGRRSPTPRLDHSPSGPAANGQEPAAQSPGLEARPGAEIQVSEKERTSTVQLLTEECANLRDRAPVVSLRGGGGGHRLVSHLFHPEGCLWGRVGSKAEVCISFRRVKATFLLDSGSDWSRGICLAQSQGFDTASEGPGEEADGSADSFPKKIKGLLRAVHEEGVHVLSLTEPPFPDTDPPAAERAPGPWREERDAYLSTISSLRALIATMREPEPLETRGFLVCPLTDWRSELLRALQDTFLQEWGLLLAALRTELAVRGAEDARGSLDQLERRLQEQGRVQAAALDGLLAADRRSLLMEVRSLRDQTGRSGRTAERDAGSGLPRPGSPGGCGEAGAGAPWERVDVAELKSQLAQVRLELAAALQARHRQAQELEALRAELRGKKDEVDAANDSLAAEQRKGRELRWALEKAEAQAARSQDRGREELEDLRLSLEDQAQRNVELSRLVAQQRQQLSDLREKTESRETLHAAQLSAERGWSAELQRLLDSEKAREPEGSAVAEQGGTHAPPPARDGEAAEEAAAELRRQVQEQQRRLAELVREAEASRLESLRAGQQLERERQAQGAALRAAQEAQAQGRQRLQASQARLEELQAQLDGRTQQVRSLERECRRSQGIVQDLRNQLRAREGKGGAGRAPDPMLSEEQAPWDLPSDRTRNWVLQQKTDRVGVNGEDGGAGECRGPVQQTLQHVASRLERLAQKASSRLPFDTEDDEDFAWLQRDVDGVIFRLLKWPGPAQPGEELPAGTPGGPGSALTERLLRQSAELTGHVSRLTAEKNDLRHAILKLEEEVRWYRGRGGFRRCFAARPDALPACERQAWSREKAALQRALRRAQAELGRLKAELRNETLLRDLGLGLDPDSAVLKRMYSRFLRAEGYRKALVYQKKYLLLLLGGFQACEEATLVLISRMAGQPAPAAPEPGPPPPPALTRFRSAARVSVAISRMRFLVRRWQRLAGSGPTVAIRDGPGSGSGKDGPAPIPLPSQPTPRHPPARTCGDLSVRPPARCHHPSLLPFFFPRGRLFPADLGPASLACSQLQNYDPDRALTDYIGRLEALQRRLGSAQPGSSAVHAGGRR